jgi:hypothetical protein
MTLSPGYERYEVVHLGQVPGLAGDFAIDNLNQNHFENSLLLQRPKSTLVTAAKITKGFVCFFHL